MGYRAKGGAFPENAFRLIRPELRRCESVVRRAPSGRVLFALVDSGERRRTRPRSRPPGSSRPPFSVLPLLRPMLRSRPNRSPSSSPEGRSAGGHSSPTNDPRASHDIAQRNEGDMGNLTVDASGRAHLELTDKTMRMSGERSIVGGRDRARKIGDLKTQPTGDVAVASPAASSASPSLALAKVGDPASLTPTR